MEKESRKASEVLLELEAKINVLLNLARTQDLTIKLLSNKVNILMEKLNSPIEKLDNIKIEAIDTFGAALKNSKLVQSEPPLLMEEKPQGFRRTSRPETYAGDDSYLKKESSTIRFPMQIPKLQEPEVIVPNSMVDSKSVEIAPSIINKKIKHKSSENLISIVQRVVDKNGKSVFLADVEVLDEQSKQLINKTRTNGAGKWMLSLASGQYKIFIKKREALNKEKLEVIQTIQVDGIENPQNLPMVIIK